ncbi:MAG: hypothetical protein IPO63_09650 [Bacteroidetes bacterium]|nr:hypothetical protein [Bacteroidota bacterium]
MEQTADTVSLINVQPQPTLLQTTLQLVMAFGSVYTTTTISRVLVIIIAGNLMASTVLVPTPPIYSIAMHVGLECKCGTVCQCFDERRLSGICNNDFLDVTQVINGDPGFCIGSTTTFLTIERYALLNIPANWQFQWKRNGLNIWGANSVSYYPKKSGIYTCVVTNAIGCTKETNAIEITVYPVADIQIQSVAGTEICNGDSISLQAISTNSTDFIWYRNGISTGFMGNEFFAKQAGRYKALASTQYGGCEKFSNRITTTVFTSTATAVGSTNICKDDSVLLQATSNGQPIQYQWIRYSQVIPGANTDQLFASKKGRYRVVITSSENCVDTSNGILVTSNCRIADFTNTNGDDVSIYPNPTSGNFEIQIEGIYRKTDEIAFLQYTDPIGKILHTTTIQFDDSGIAMCNAPTSLSKGMYILLIQYGELRFKSKIFIIP